MFLLYIDTILIVNSRDNYFNWNGKHTVEHNYYIRDFKCGPLKIIVH